MSCFFPPRSPPGVRSIFPLVRQSLNFVPRHLSRIHSYIPFSASRSSRYRRPFRPRFLVSPWQRHRPLVRPRNWSSVSSNRARRGIRSLDLARIESRRLQSGKRNEDREDPRWTVTCKCPCEIFAAIRKWCRSSISRLMHLREYIAGKSWRCNAICFSRLRLF